jgi:hypothetical protein
MLKIEPEMKPVRTGWSTGDRLVYRHTGRSKIQTGTGPDRPVTGTGSISELNYIQRLINQPFVEDIHYQK